MQDAGVSGRELANRLNISPARVSQLVNGEGMSEAQIRTVCEVLDISADTLIFDQAPADQHEAEYVRHYRRLDPECRVALVKIMRCMD